MLCVRCNHPVSEHTGYGGKCMHREKGYGLCTCQRVLKPRLPIPEDKKENRHPGEVGHD